jgi:hypothetical protein
MMNRMFGRFELGGATVVVVVDVVVEVVDVVSGEAIVVGGSSVVVVCAREGDGTKNSASTALRRPSGFGKCFSIMGYGGVEVRLVPNDDRG